MKHEVTIAAEEIFGVSVLSVEPWGMKPQRHHQSLSSPQVSVLSVEPWGMKLPADGRVDALPACFSALGRAVGDETPVNVWS